MTVERVERVLAQVQDQYGTISVLEVEDYRFLEFGDAIEQSCVFTADPSWLEYDYTRAMLVAALCHAWPSSTWDWMTIRACISVLAMRWSCSTAPSLPT